MLPTFVIGLREGLEAALIVGIVAAFLRAQGRRDLLRWVLVGVGVAVVLCVGVGVALEVYSRELPQRQQEGLETIIGVIAVGMVTYMVVWMRRHSRELKGQLEGLAAQAIEGRSRAGRAMVLMAFLAVIREGMETVVFLIAAFNEAGSSSAAGLGASLGIAVAVLLGYGIYRGGVRINLSRFFRVTGLVLVLVAAGLVVNALHTAHEAGWLDIGQGRTVDLSGLVEPGTVQASLLTGMLGVQPYPVTIEVVGWLLYLVPIGCYVAWTSARPVPTRLLARLSAAVAVLAGAAALVLTLVAPAAPSVRPDTAGSRVASRDDTTAVVSTADRQPVGSAVGARRDVELALVGPLRVQGVAAQEYRASVPGSQAGTGRPATLDLDTVARLNGGRLPIGISPTSAAITAAYRDERTLTAVLDARTDRILDLRWSERVLVTVSDRGRAYPLDQPLEAGEATLPASVVTPAVAAARADHASLDRRAAHRGLALWCTGLALVAALASGGFALSGWRRSGARAARPVPDLRQD